MASDLDLSLLTPSITSLRTQSSRKKTSLVYEYCRDPYEDEPKRKNGRLLYYCRICPDKIEENGYPSTTNLRNHLSSKHQIECDARGNRTKGEAHQRLAELYTEAMELDVCTTEIESTVLNKTLNKDILNQALVNLIIVRNLPFSAVQWPEFHIFCGALNPESIESGILLTAPITVVSYIKESFIDQKDVI